MRVLGVVANSRRRAFEVRTRRGTFVFPFSECDPSPSRDDRVVRVFADPELGREAFTYQLESEKQASVHIDAVLEYNADPTYMAELALYRLAVEARERFEQSPLSVREVARRLGTSASQLYRLLNPTNYSKSLQQLLSLLYVLGYEVHFELTAKRGAGRPKPALVGDARAGYLGSQSAPRHARPAPGPTRDSSRARARRG